MPGTKRRPPHKRYEHKRSAIELAVEKIGLQPAPPKFLKNRDNLTRDEAIRLLESFGIRPRKGRISDGQGSG